MGRFRALEDRQLPLVFPTQAGIDRFCFSVFFLNALFSPRWGQVATYIVGVFPTRVGIDQRWRVTWQARYVFPTGAGIDRR
jgi:hypothetical protein